MINDKWWNYLRFEGGKEEASDWQERMGEIETWKHCIVGQWLAWQKYLKFAATILYIYSCSKIKILPSLSHPVELQNGKSMANGVTNGIHLHSNGFRLSEAWPQSR